MKILIEEEKLQERIKALAKEIERDYEGKEIVLLCILKGSIYFTVDLSKHISNPLQIEFMQVSSYGNTTKSSGQIDLKLDVSDSIQGKDVIIIEDIIDTGRTLSYLVEYLKKKGIDNIKICTLLDKPDRREFNITVDYVGFQIPDKFVVGYGLDYNQLYRNLPYIAYIEE